MPSRGGAWIGVEHGIRSTWRVQYTVPETAAVTVVLPTGSKLDLLGPCLS